MKKIAIFASGNGTNAEAIIRYYQERGRGNEIALVLTNNEQARVRERVRPLGVESIYVPREQWNEPAGEPLRILRQHGIDAIALAGFMVKVPKAMIDAYPGRILNLHPALLPLHGGKGMYGHHVHEAVVAQGDEETGITIHIIDEHYDQGQNIFQASFPVVEGDTAESVEARIHPLEHKHYPHVLMEFVDNL